MGHTRLSYRTLIVGATLIAAICPVYAAQQKEAAIPGDRILWGKLQGSFDTENIKPGAPVTARVVRAWSTKTCMIRSGITLTGAVATVAAKSAATPATTATLSFTAPCSEGQTIALKLVALFYPVDDGKSQMDVAMSMPAGIGPGASGRQSTNLDTLPTPGTAGPELPPTVKVGQVKGVRHVTLDASSASGRASVLISPDPRLHLQPGTRMAFLVTE